MSERPGINMKITQMIWIDPAIDSFSNQGLFQRLNIKGSIKIKECINVFEALYYMKHIKFEETKIIVSGKFYPELIKIFKENIIKMHIAPKIIVFTSNKEKFFEFNIDYLECKNKFYNFGGIATKFGEIEDFLNKEITDDIPRGLNILPLPSNFASLDREEKFSNSNDSQLTFEYIDSKEKLMLPLFFKTLIDTISKDETEKYTESLYHIYYQYNDIRNLLGQLISIPNIPIEILCKYYARLYTIESNFYKDMNKDLGFNKIKKYLQYIKILYEGVKLKSLPLAVKKKLYRGSKISNKELIKLDTYFKNKKRDLPAGIVFSRSFLSFTKIKSKALGFLFKKEKNEINEINDLSPVLFKLTNDNTLDYDLSTHGEIEKISFHPLEKEVLFFPFSAFEIKGMKTKTIEGKKVNVIKLLYLGKYLKDIENDINLIKNENLLPDSEFKRQLSEYGLIKKEKIENIKTKILYDCFKIYEKSVKEVNLPENGRIETEVIKKTEFNITSQKFYEKKNIIIGEIYINQDDINKDIQIINSFENYQRHNQKGKQDDYNYENEKEIKENTEIKINGKLIGFSYCHKFENDGFYEIQYLFKKKLNKTNHMFYDCNKLTYLFLSNFNSKNVTNMSYMFGKCNSLLEINLKDFNTQNVTNMSNMFYKCKSLLNLDLSNFNTQNVTNMSDMFCCCKTITKLNLEFPNFQTNNVTSMKGMFYKCNSLSNLNISNFITKNVNNMSFMFSNCHNLIKLNLAHFNTQNVINMSGMFSESDKLTEINLSNFDTQKVNNMSGMFFECKSLLNLNITNFQTKNVTNMSHMFSKCVLLNSLDLSNFETQRVTDMSHMFFKCNKITKLNLSNFDMKNVTNVNKMLKGCESLEERNIITKDKKILSLLNN